MSGLPSLGQSIADIVQAALGVYVFISVRSGGLRQKRVRDKRMDDWLDGTEASTAFDAVPSAPARLHAVELAVARNEQTTRQLVRSVSVMRDEMGAGLRAARVEAERQQRRDAV